MPHLIVTHTSAARLKQLDCCRLVVSFDDLDRSGDTYLACRQLLNNPETEYVLLVGKTVADKVLNVFYVKKQHKSNQIIYGNLKITKKKILLEQKNAAIATFHHIMHFVSFVFWFFVCLCFFLGKTIEKQIQIK